LLLLFGKNLSLGDARGQIEHEIDRPAFLCDLGIE
jgi:hypothetical protein